MKTVTLGYVIASHEITEHGKSVGFLYRESTDDVDDSGWRLFSGEESDEYMDDASNFSMYNASTIVDLDPGVARVLASPAPATFERDPSDNGFRRVPDDDC